MKVSRKTVLEPEKQMMEAGSVLIVALTLEASSDTWTPVQSSNLSSDSDVLEDNITLDPLTSAELNDVETSRKEIASGESKHFSSLDNAFSWLDSE